MVLKNTLLYKRIYPKDFINIKRPVLDISNQSKYLPALDGMRAVAILLVFFSHLGLEGIIPGAFGVTFFFFISGFLITRLLIHEFDKTNQIDLKKFYIRRLIRLYPPLLLMVLVYTLAILIFEKPINYLELVSVTFYFENYFLAYFNQESTAYFFICWSLAVEEHFYLLFPLVFLFAYKLRSFILLIIILIAIALAFRIFYTVTLSEGEAFIATYKLTHCRFDSILYGCLSAILIHKKSNLYKLILRRKEFFLLAIVLLASTFFYREQDFRNTFRYTLQGLALMIIVPAIVMETKYSSLNKLFSGNWLVYIGKLSYSIYVMHWICIFVANELFLDSKMPTRINPFLWYVLVLLGTILLTLTSYHLMERRFIKMRQKFGSVVSY